MKNVALTAILVSILSFLGVLFYYTQNFILNDSSRETYILTASTLIISIIVFIKVFISVKTSRI